MEQSASPDEIIFVYCVCADAAEAEKIAQGLLDQRLIACANILPPHTSLYRWKGAIERGQEVAMILKTRASLFGDLERAIKAMHSYEVPCIVAWSVTLGNPAFFEWVKEETSGSITLAMARE